MAGFSARICYAAVELEKRVNKYFPRNGRKHLQVPKSMKQQYIIRSTHREDPNAYFAAIHRSTPMFFDRDKARRFSSQEMATAYARTELFTEDTAFQVLPAAEAA